ncbi:MAG: cyanobactin biosynthesis system PatB/AcyB/McaB family protein [Cyanobacteria bacterium P01_G01_bin.54]
MTFPKQTPPVKRPHFTQPALTVDVENGSADSLVQIRMDLLHGANYNDPAVFVQRGYDQVMRSGWGRMGSRGRSF